MDLSSSIPYLLVLFALGEIFFCAPTIEWAIRPLTQEAKTRPRQRQFTIADFLCLFVLLQFPMALIHAVAIENLKAKLLLDAWAWVMVALAWVQCVGLLTRAGVRRGTHRAVFLLLLFPIVFLTALSLPLVPVAVYLILFGGPRFDVSMLIPILFVAWAVIALPSARWFTRRMVEKARAAMSSADEAADNAAAREE